MQELGRWDGVELIWEQEEKGETKKVQADTLCQNRQRISRSLFVWEVNRN